MNKTPKYKKAFFNGVALVLFVILGVNNQTAQAQNGVSNVQQDPVIEELLTLKTKMVKDNELTDRYKIQLYSGEREKAYEMLKKYRNKIGEWPSSIEYQTPNYKVWIGNYRNRLEADRALLTIKKSFSSAFIFKPDR